MIAELTIETSTAAIAAMKQPEISTPRTTFCATRKISPLMIKTPIPSVSTEKVTLNSARMVCHASTFRTATTIAKKNASRKLR